VHLAISSHRSIAPRSSGVSSGRVLNAIAALGAPWRMAFTMLSKEHRLLEGWRRSPPITTQSQAALPNCAAGIVMPPSLGRSCRGRRPSRVRPRRDACASARRSGSRTSRWRGLAHVSPWHIPKPNSRSSPRTASVEDGYDLVIRINPAPDERLAGRRFLADERLIVAAPNLLRPAVEGAERGGFLSGLLFWPACCQTAFGACGPPMVGR